MKLSEKFRFSLQWRAESLEQIQAGEFLERLGNKKSEIVVAAIAAYIQAHPEMMNMGGTVQIVVKPSLPRENIEALIRNIIDEKLAEKQSAVQTKTENPDSTPIKIDDNDIAEMLKNLDVFIDNK